MIKRNWKKILIVLIVIAALVLVGIFLKKYNASQSQLGAFTSPDGSFSTQLPKAWDAQITSKGAIVVTFVTDSIQSTSNVKPYINIAKGAFSGDLNTVYAETTAKYQKLFRNIKVVDNGTVSIDGKEGKKFVFDGTLGGRVMRYAVIVTQEQGVIYTITSAAAPADFPQVQPVLDSMASSWKFLQ
ncbi:hypothetical protein KA478_00140 [Patescibacteria group bacterium]|nr:hypothetical protein [Patescibacteria group bacterium]